MDGVHSPSWFAAIDDDVCSLISLDGTVDVLHRRMKPFEGESVVFVNHKLNIDVAVRDRTDNPTFVCTIRDSLSMTLYFLREIVSGLSPSSSSRFMNLLMAAV